MIYLQTHHNSIKLDAPKRLVEGVDFDIIWGNKLMLSNALANLNQTKKQQKIILDFVIKNNITSVELNHDQMKIDISNAEFLVAYQNEINKTLVTFVANISDCYESRALIEIDGFCEFDLVSYTYNNDHNSIVTEFDIVNIIDMSISPFSEPFGSSGGAYYEPTKTDYKNFGGIFTPQNQISHPEYYQQALNIIYK